MGYYIPTRHQPEQAELEALKQAVLQLDKLLIDHGLSVDTLVSEFQTLRKNQEKTE